MRGQARGEKMNVSKTVRGREDEIAGLFAATFAQSEGAEEGALIGGLARDLMRDTPKDDIEVFTADEAGRLIGAAIFTRLRYARDERRVFILSPMAVATDRQGEGIGQALLTQALNALRAQGVAVAITYGDPAYYAQVGFAPLSEADAAAPLPLSHPEGWIGQSLSEAALAPLKGPSTCVKALDNPAYW